MSHLFTKGIPMRDKKSEYLKDVHSEALKNYDITYKWDNHNRREALDDIAHLLGEQWPADIVAMRNRENRPIVTINKLPSFVDQVIGDSRQNKIGIKIRPATDGATEALAETYNGLIRNIENQSSAQVAYQNGMYGSTSCGLGAWRINTVYEDCNIFDQVVRIDPIWDPLSVYWDPAAKEPDKRDAKWVLIEEDIGKEEFKERWPDVEPMRFPNKDYQYWVDDNIVKIAEYWRKKARKTTLVQLENGSIFEKKEWEQVADDLKEEEQPVYLDEMGILRPGPAPGPGYKEIIINEVPEVILEKRTTVWDIEHYIIDGEKILEGPNKWAGKFIPIVLCFGKINNKRGKEYRRGIIRHAKEPQRLYNYSRTMAVEALALPPRAPYLVTPNMIDGYAHQWDNASIKPLPYLMWNPDPNAPGLTPQRLAPSIPSSGDLTEIQITNDELKATTGIFDASLGAQGNETSGVAITARQREGDVATFEYHDNLSRAIKYTGEILVDLIPRIYDTQRQVTILHEDDEDQTITINKTVFDKDTQKDVILNDISVGKYGVTVTVGPSYSTQRIESVNNMIQMIQAIPALGNVAADLVVKNMDFPGSDTIAERYNRTLPVNITATDEELQQQQQQGQQETPDQVKDILDIQNKQLMNEGKKMDLAEKQLDLQKQSGEIQQQMAAVAQAAVVRTLQQLGIIPQQQPQATQTTGVNPEAITPGLLQ